jgi:hypothetical protein
MTEDEAKTKWCPEARAVAIGPTGRAAANRNEFGEIYTAHKCLGSACMAWRWLDEDDRIGYCGKAGVP